MGRDRGSSRAQKCADARSARKRGCLGCLLLLMPLVWTVPACAGGPRFVSGMGEWGIPGGQPEGWAVSRLLYFTDPGDLNSSVSHARTDAMVAAAAAVWNVPTSSLSLAQGGTLAEHVSGANTYLNGADVVFPADVAVSNEGAVPLPIIYDTDGSITDLLLGSGASEPSSCRQNGVTESVDDIQQEGHIHHAMIILNGRCVGSAPEQLTQMQYQLARAFGRVLGVSWSQTNDNVFTAVATVTANQEAYWPLMHPLDVLCGTYSYQCMINPFTLRPDDLDSLALLYPVTVSSQASGKQISAEGAVNAWGTLSFPTGQGMDWVNITTSRQNAGATETWQVVSVTTGWGYQQALGTPVTGSQVENQGSYFADQEGFFLMPAIPAGGLSNVFFTSEPINPLYSGQYALAPYLRPPATPSGLSQTTVDWSTPGGAYQSLMTPSSAASSCTPDNDGSEGAPASLDPSGWQDGLLCGWGHSSWWGATVRAGHSWTLEVTATDESGAASIYKAQPVVGVWKASDGTGTLPTLGSEAVPFNSMAYGVTQLRMRAPASDTPVRFVVSDQFGAGRPDFTYTARMLYADNVSPATVGAGGGVITITGTGFRQGNVVRVNGVAATVRSWTATEIVATAPARISTGALIGVPVSVSVTDASTGGSTSIGSAFSYSNAPDLLQEVSAPAAIETGVTAGIPFAVRVLASDGVTPLPGATVSFALTNGTATLGACGNARSCLVTTDNNGIAQTAVSGGAVGSVTATATEVSGGASVQMTASDTDPVRAVAISQNAVYVAAGAGGSWTVQLTSIQDGVAMPNVGVTWSAGPGLTLNPGGTRTGLNGSTTVSVSAGNVSAGFTSTVTGCVWTNLCATWTLYGVDASQWQIAVASGAGQSVSQGTLLSSVGLLVTDGAGHPLQGAPVSVYQRVLAWEGICGTPGRCAEAPVLMSSEQNEVSGPGGLISLTPTQMPGIPQTVQLAASTGTEGFVTVTLVKTPAP